MRIYQDLVIEIKSFDNQDIITTSVGRDNVSGAKSTWNGWDTEEVYE